MCSHPSSILVQSGELGGFRETWRPCKYIEGCDPRVWLSLGIPGSILGHTVSRANREQPLAEEGKSLPGCPFLP